VRCSGLLTIGLATQGHAAFPGKNGRIVFQRAGGDNPADLPGGQARGRYAE
jgi:hypothetical protein